MIKIFRLSTVIIFLAFVLTSAPKASAAVLNLSVFGESFKIGDELRVDIRIDSEEVGINAAQATLRFSKDVIEAVRLDKTDSVFNFWLEEPSFSNENGQIRFIGGSTIGYTGRSLQVLKIFFKIKGSGFADLVFLEGAVTASDGSGTNVLREMKSARISVLPLIEPLPLLPPALPLLSPPPVALPTPVPVTRPAVPAAKLPVRPVLEVPLYPGPEKWHNISSNFLVRWELPDDVSDVATAINENPNFSPAKSEGLFDGKIFPALEDGIWYLHVRFRNNIGWGPAAHWRLAIDTAPPLLFRIESAAGFTTDNPVPVINFKTGDNLSGLDYYDIRIGSGDLIVTEEPSYTLPLQAPGKHRLTVRAYDKAGNASEDTVELEILPIASPVITSFTGEIFIGEGGLEVNGTAPVDFSVVVSIKKRDGQLVTTASASPDEKENWRILVDFPFKKGKYFIVALSRDKRGALSLPVVSELFRVRERPLFTIAGVGITQFWFFAGLIAILLAGFAIGWNTSRLAKIQRGRKIFISQRDTAAICGLVKKDVDMALKNYSDQKIDEREAGEMEFLLKRAKENIEKMGKYLIEGIKEIND